MNPIVINLMKRKLKVLNMTLGKKLVKINFSRTSMIFDLMIISLKLKLRAKVLKFSSQNNLNIKPNNANPMFKSN
jgi:hypothetical protein